MERALREFDGCRPSRNSSASSSSWAAGSKARLMEHLADAAIEPFDRTVKDHQGRRGGQQNDRSDPSALQRTSNLVAATWLALLPAEPAAELAALSASSR